MKIKTLYVPLYVSWIASSLILAGCGGHSSPKDANATDPVRSSSNTPSSETIHDGVVITGAAQKSYSKGGQAYGGYKDGERRHHHPDHDDGDDQDHGQNPHRTDGRALAAPGATAPVLLQATGLESGKTGSITEASGAGFLGDVSSLSSGNGLLIVLEEDSGPVDCVAVRNGSAETIRATVSGGHFASSMSQELKQGTRAEFCPQAGQ